MKLPISFCIPTKDRPEDLKKCLKSIFAQTALPHEIVIIDDGNLNQAAFREIIEPATNFKYFKKDKPSLSASKNLIKNLASNDLIFICDDDIVLDTDFIQNIFEIFERDTKKEVGIVGGVMVNRKNKNLIERIFRRIFLLDNGKPGRLLPWGFQTGYYHTITKDEKVDWVSGGAACFRKEVLKEFNFEEFLGGRNALEDVEFGYKTMNKYTSIVTPKSKFHHFHSLSGREAKFTIGFKEAYNRCWIFKKHVKKNVRNILFFCWAMIGQLFGVLFTRGLRFFAGNVMGIIAFIKSLVT